MNHSSGISHGLNADETQIEGSYLSSSVFDPCFIRGFFCSLFSPRMIRLRPLRLVLLAAALWTISAAPLLAADAAADADWRGPGGYCSWVKLLAFWLVFLAWVRSADWINRDGQAMKLDLLRWNPIVFGSFLGGAMLFFLIPFFWLGYPLLLIVYAAPLVSYVLYRNARVHDSDKAFTPDHLRWLAAHWLGMVGIKIAVERRDARDAGAPVKLVARGGGDDRVDRARLLSARQSPGLPTAKDILGDAIARRASAVLLDYSPQGVAVRCMIDGVWLPQANREREAADPALESLKLLCGLNPQDRQSRQEGVFGLEYSVLRQSVFDKVEKSKAKFREKLAVELTKKLRGEEGMTEAALQQRVQAEVERRTREKFVPRVGVWTPVAKDRLPKIQGVDQINPNSELEKLNRPATLVSQAVGTGERAIVQFETISAHLKTLADLGMREKMQEQFTELLNRPKGFVLLSALPANGLRTTMDVMLRGVDRFLREFVAVEDEANPRTAIENIPVTTYKASAGESPATILVKLFRKEPNVVVVRDLVDGQTVSLLCRETVQNDRVMIGSILRQGRRRGDVADADAEGPAAGIRRGDFRRVVPAAGAEALRDVQGALRPRRRRAATIGHSPGTHPRLLPSPPTEAGRREGGAVSRVRRHRLPGANGRVRADRRRRPHAEDAGQLAEARSAPPGRAKGRHAESSRGRHSARRPRRHLARGVDAGVETVREEERS